MSNVCIFSLSEAKDDNVLPLFFVVVTLILAPAGAHRASTADAGWAWKFRIQNGGGKACNACTTPWPHGETAGGGAADDATASVPLRSNQAGSPGADGGAEENLSHSTPCLSGDFRKSAFWYNLNPESGWTRRSVLDVPFTSQKKKKNPGQCFLMSSFICHVYLLKLKQSRKQMKPVNQRPSSWRWKPGPNPASNSWRMNWGKTRLVKKKSVLYTVHWQLRMF